MTETHTGGAAHELKADATRETDCAIIRDLEWIDELEETPLPVDPEDYKQLRAAREWAQRTIIRFDYELWVRELEGEDVDAGEMFAQYDRLAMSTFLAAVKRRMRAMEEWDRAKLDAWNAGKPIPTSGVIV